jgi:protoheme IX farnesyltransferase
MLPVVAGPAETRKQILLYSIVLVPLAILPAFIGLGGITYGAASIVLGAVFLWFAFDVWRITEGREADKACKRLFWFSILYLYALFAILVVEGVMNRLLA